MGCCEDDGRTLTGIYIPLKTTFGILPFGNQAGGATLSGKFDIPWNERWSTPECRGSASSVVTGFFVESRTVSSGKTCWALLPVPWTSLETLNTPAPLAASFAQQTPAAAGRGKKPLRACRAQGRFTRLAAATLCVVAAVQPPAIG